MIDIVNSTSEGMSVYNTQTERAANILSVQLGALEYAKSLGIDLRYFLSEEISFQNDSFKAYIIQILAANGINVANLIETIEALSSTYTINLTPDNTQTGLITR